MATPRVRKASPMGYARAMNSLPPERIASVVTPASDHARTGPALTGKEVDAILEIAYFAIAADRQLLDSELEGYRVVAGRVRALAGGSPSKLTERELNARLDGYARDRDREETVERLRVLAEGLSPTARDIAYRVSVALSLVDLATSDEEFDFDFDLQDALKLSNEDAERLNAEVQTALYEGDDLGGDGPPYRTEGGP